MEKEQAKILIDKIFNSKFSKEEYTKFSIALLDKLDIEKQFTCGNAMIPAAFRDHINSYGRIGKFEDAKGKELEVLWVNLKKETALDKARTMQRNFIAWYLNKGRGKKRENALVAFYNDEQPDWRFSFVKMDYSLVEKDSGNIGIKKEFTPARRYSFLVGENEPNHTAQSRLLDILEKEYPLIADIEDAFNIEKVSKEFFAKYKDLFYELVDDLKEIRKKDTRINHEFTVKQVTEANFCKKLMGQIVFLYFLQKKGWLGVDRYKDWGTGNKKFLRTLFEDAEKTGKNYFNDYLEYLFYEALNNGERDDFYGKFDCKIPFLNGGLFEPIGNLDGYDWVNTDITIPNEVFSNTKKTKEGDIGTGILDVFDRYNFTVKEDEPLEKEVAVDPEMLGKVFEELLDVVDRKSKGAFYTPREIVHYMCQESLINYLATELETKVPKEAISDFIHYGDIVAQNEVVARAKEKAGTKTTKYEYELHPSIREHAKLIDEKLENIRICDPAIGSGAFPVGMMNEIIRARMTLLEAGYINESKKRNPYEYKRQAIQNCIYGVDIDSGAIEIAKLRLWLSLVVDEDDIKTIKPLPNLDYKIVCGNSLLDLDGVLISNDLKERFIKLADDHFDETRKREKKKLKKEIDDILEHIFKMSKSFGSNANFDFRLFFYDVFKEKGGFDIVIGNPPYIDSEGMVNIGLEYLREYISKNYKMAKGNWDIYIAFFEKGFSVLGNNGTLSYITPDKWISKPFGDELRKGLINNMDSILFAGRKVFESAKVDSIVTLITKKHSSNLKISSYENNIFSAQKEVTKKILKEPFALDFVFSKNLDLLLKIEKIHTKLKDYALCESACATSDAYKLKPLICDLKANKFDSNSYFKVINTGTISKYKSKWGYSKMTYLKDKYENPVIKKEDFFNEFKNSYSKKVLKPKIIIKGLTLLDACLDIECQIIPGKSTLIINDDSNNKIKFLAAIINSKLPIFYIKEKYSASSYNGGINFTKDMLNDFPLKSLSEQEQTIFIINVDNICEILNTDDYLDNQHKQAQVKKIQDEIDLMVYKLYELDYSEVLVVDPDFKMSEAEYNSYSLPVGEAV